MKALSNGVKYVKTNKGWMKEQGIAKGEASNPNNSLQTGKGQSDVSSESG